MQRKSSALALSSFPQKNTNRAERTKLAAESSSAFPVLTKGTLSDSVQNQEREQRKAVAAHNGLLHGSDGIFQQKSLGDANNSRSKTTKANQRQTGSECSGVPSVTDDKNLLQTTEVELTSAASSVKNLTLCDSPCCHSCSNKLQVKGSETKLHVHGMMSLQLIDTEAVGFSLTPVFLSLSTSKMFFKFETTLSTSTIF